MASVRVLLLELLLVSLASASHHMGGRTSFTYRGRNPDGSYTVDIYNRDTYDRCTSSLYWSCYKGNCGSIDTHHPKAVIDSSTNAPSYERLWCETETVQTRRLPSNRPFSMRASSCCWIQTRNSVFSWRFLSSIDLGTRSDTKEPNRSPDIGMLPFLRVPQNCPRTYKLVNFDPDGDKVRCRYANIHNIECSRCDQPSGFNLNKETCTLQYNSASYDYRIYGLEMMVEDFPRKTVTLTYSDGSQSVRNPLSRRKRGLVNPYAPWYYTTTTAAPTTSSWHWWWWTTPATTTTTAGPNSWWWWRTSTAPTPNPRYLGRWTTTTAAPTTTTAAPTTTTAAPTTTTAAPTTTTAAPTTTTAAPTTTTAAPTTTPWPTTTTPWPTTTTAAPTTTTAPFPIVASNEPFSKLPLQFAFLVDKPAPSCVPGYYLPKFVSPTPANEAHIYAEVEKEVEIRVKAQTLYSTIDSIIFSGPQNTKKQKNTRNEFTITWTPKAADLGNHFVICFAVEAKRGADIYQSDMRCVIVDVGKKTVKTYVTCSESMMRVEVDKSSFPRLSEDHLQLSDPSNVICSLKTHSNSSHVIAIIPLNACGTQIEEDDDYLKFKNEITTFDNLRDVITRKHLLEVQFYCQYPKRGNVTQSFLAHRKSVTVWDKGMGKFTYQFEFYPDVQFKTMMDPNSYPLEYDLGSRIYMQIEAKSSVNNTELFVESCRAAPYDNPNYKPVYSIIENGCKVDQTVQRHTTDHGRQFKFSVEAFKFIGLHDQVYISCSVLMCRAGDPNTRCAKGCIKSTQTNSLSWRRGKREVVTQSSTHLVSQGPLRLVRSAERADSSVMNLNLNMVFIVGCLLAAVGMISGVVLYKAKISKVKYQPLPTFEN